MDSVPPKRRSESSPGSAPENSARPAYRFRPRLPIQAVCAGSAWLPDLVFRSRRKVIFVHGCFWHRHAACTLARTPLRRGWISGCRNWKAISCDRKNKRALARGVEGADDLGMQAQQRRPAASHDKEVPRCVVSNCSPAPEASRSPWKRRRFTTRPLSNRDHDACETFRENQRHRRRPQEELAALRR